MWAYLMICADHGPYGQTTWISHYVEKVVIPTELRYLRRGHDITTVL